MIRRWLPILVLALSMTSRFVIADDVLAPDPFIAASAIPKEVNLYLHVENAAALRAELANRPIDHWLASLVGHGEMAHVWRELGDKVGLEPEALFDACLGKSFTLVTLPDRVTSTGGADQPSLTRWILLAEIDPARTRPVLDRLNLRHLRPSSGRALAELPEHELLFCFVGDLMMIGPKRESDLFWRLVPDLGQMLPDSLATTDLAREADKLGTGRIGLLVRHDLPLGGWSAIVADLVGDRITIKHAGRFASSPFERPVTETTWDAAPLRAFEESALMVVMEPADIGGGSTGAYIEDKLGRKLISPRMRPNLGKTRVFTLGESEQSAGGEDTVARASTFGLILPLRSTDDAQRHLDLSMLDISRRLNAMHGGELIRDMPDEDALPPGEPRRVQLNPTVELFGGAMPVMEHVSLNWTYVQRDDAAYYVIASHPDHLAAMVKALSRPCEAGQDVGRWTSCGSANGERLGMHLRGYSDQASLFNAGDPADAAQFRQTMLMLSELATGINRCRWHLSRPGANDMRLDVELVLSPPRANQ